MKVINAVWNYLKDWRNLLTHGLVGVLILVVALVIPVKPIFRVLILVAVVGLNLLRMKYTKKVAPDKE